MNVDLISWCHPVIHYFFSKKSHLSNNCAVYDPDKFGLPPRSLNAVLTLQPTPRSLSISNSHRTALWVICYRIQLANENFSNGLLHMLVDTMKFIIWTILFGLGVLEAVYYSAPVPAEAFRKVSVSQAIDLGANRGNIMTPAYAVQVKYVAMFFWSFTCCFCSGRENIPRAVQMFFHFIKIGWQHFSACL